MTRKKPPTFPGGRKTVIPILTYEKTSKENEISQLEFLRFKIFVFAKTAVFKIAMMSDTKKRILYLMAKRWSVMTCV